MPRISNAQSAQRKHWETTGQLYRLLGLIAYIQDKNRFLSTEQNQLLNKAFYCIDRVLNLEYHNNEFINLNLKPAWKKRK